jgi:methionyl-tRNA formyltransferase
MPYRIVFMGTPQFAIPTLQGLIDWNSPEETRGQVVAVVTQPDRPTGRGQLPKPSPVKRLAQQVGLPVLEPKSLRDPQVLAELRAWQPELIVVAAFGQILPAPVLELPRFGCLNVHASLLPRWRGAAPVAAAILAGDASTGVTIMQMDAGLDTGPILRQRSLAVDPDDTNESLTARLAQLGADLLRDMLPDWLTGNIEPHAQDETLATYAPQLKKEQGQVNWNDPAEHIARQVRAFYPWPAAFTYWQGQPLKILRAAAAGEAPPATGDQAGADSKGLPGTVNATPEGPAVVTGRGVLYLREVQPAGRRPMPADAFARGARGFVGARLV